MHLAALFPHWRGLHITHICAADDHLTLTAQTTRRTARCPRCHRLSAAVHSRYQRRVADLPCAGRAVTLDILARRFFCRSPDCPQRTFTERLTGLVASGARRSHALTRIGMALGGKAGARLAGHLGMPTSDDALLRLVRTAPLPMAAPSAILDVDDWAWKRGRRYGTILCDLARHRVIDLLSERSADSVAAWLGTCPDVSLIARDRSDLYADGARRGAPHARQIADRFHLLKNLGEALERFLQHKRAIINQAIAPSVPSAPAVPAEPGQPWQERQEADSLRRHAAVLARYKWVIALHIKGAEIAAIARAVGISRTTVYRYLRLGGPPERKQPRPRRRQHKVLDPYKEHLLQRWEEGCHTATRLWREIRGLGYPLLLRERRALPRPAAAAGRPAPEHPSRTGHERPDADAAAGGDARPAAPRATDCGATSAACPSVRSRRDDRRRPDAGARICDHRPRTAGERLDAWIADAIAADIPDLRRFALGLLPDKRAIQAGITEEWSNGQTEGQINRLKTLKRQMYGRAGFDLLRQRFLHPP